MKRKTMLKAAQVTSLQQRELSMQKKLYQFLHRFTENVTIQLGERHPTEEFNLPELIHLTGAYLDDIIRFDQNFGIDIEQRGKSRSSSTAKSHLMQSTRTLPTPLSASMKTSSSRQHRDVVLPERAQSSDDNLGRVLGYESEERSAPVECVDEERISHSSRSRSRLSPSRPAPKKPIH